MGSTLHNGSCSNGNIAIPRHQQHFFEESCKDLTEEHGDNVARLLTKKFLGIQLLQVYNLPLMLL